MNIHDDDDRGTSSSSQSNDAFQCKRFNKWLCFISVEETCMNIHHKSKATKMTWRFVEYRKTSDTILLLLYLSVWRTRSKARIKGRRSEPFVLSDFAPKCVYLHMVLLSPSYINGVGSQNLGHRHWMIIGDTNPTACLNLVWSNHRHRWKWVAKEMMLFTIGFS